MYIGFVTDTLNMNNIILSCKPFKVYEQLVSSEQHTVNTRNPHVMSSDHHIAHVIDR